MEDKLTELNQMINQLIYSNNTEADSDTRALADTVVDKMMFFVRKGRHPKKPEAEIDVTIYEDVLNDLRHTKRPKKIRDLMAKISKQFATDARMLGYSATKARPKLPGTDFLLARLQLKDKLMPEDLAYLKKIKGNIRKMCFIFACQMVRGDGDVPLLMTGAPGFGKGSLAIRICRRVTWYLREYDWGPLYNEFGELRDMKKDVPEWSYHDILWAGQAKEEINNYYGYAHFNRKIVDDAYMDALNLESNSGKAIFIGKTMNVTRSKNNLTIFCYQVPTRTTSFLMEAFYLWIHKYTQPIVQEKKAGRAIFLARTKIYTTDDPWNTRRLRKSENEMQIVSRLASNPNKVGFLKPKTLSPADFKAYEAEKHAAEDVFRIKNTAKDLIESAIEKYALEVRAAVGKKLLTGESESDIEMFIREKHPKYSFNRRQIKGIIRQYREMDFAFAISGEDALEVKANKEPRPEGRGISELR